MDHRPYPKIATTLSTARGADLARTDRAASAAVKLGPSVSWVATEKIHGAQFVVATDGVAVAFGKRKAWLADGEAFFGWQLLRRDLEGAARQFHRDLGAGSVVRLYGEIFGGAYPHPAVPSVPGMSPVQTGIWYAPGVHFAVFDVLVDDDDGGLFLAHSDVTRLATAAGLGLPPLLHRGPRGEVDALEVRFPTRVPRALGLPALADNFAEGLVIKPDLASRPLDRPVLKRKISDFDEARFDESAPFDKSAPLDLAALTALGAQLVNRPRIESARSKLGEVAPEALVEEVVLDVLVDLEATFPRAMGELGEKGEDALRAALGKRAVEWVTR